MAIPATQFAETRKEKALMERMAMSRALREGGAAAQAFSGMGVSPDPAATEQIFEGTYQDELIPGINSLMKMIALENGLEDKKREIAKHLALSGLVAIETHVVGNKFVNTLCEPDEVVWDPASIRPDMADGEFAFAAPVMTVQQIAEQYQLRAKDLEEIDQWARDDNMSGGWPGGMPSTAGSAPTTGIRSGATARNPTPPSSDRGSARFAISGMRSRSRARLPWCPSSVGPLSRDSRS